MAQKGYVTTCIFQANLKPHKKIGATHQGQLWQKLLSTELRVNLGDPDIDHITMGRGGETHIEYYRKDLLIVLYDDGEIRLEDDKFTTARSTQIERVLTAIFKTLNSSTKGNIDFDATMTLHHRSTDKAVAKFLSSNIRFTSGRNLRKAIGKLALLRSFILELEDNLDMLVITPNHIDFIYHDTISSGANRKEFVKQFLASSMKYVESMRKYA